MFLAVPALPSAQKKAYKLALKNNKARMVFVTKSDLENSDYFKILEQLKIKFGPSICPCVVPARLDDGTVAYINLFSQKAFKYESGKQVQIDLPDIGHRFEGLIQAMYEAIAETDETLMEKFFEGEPFTTEEIVTGMAAGVRTGQITPVFCGSAVNLQALDMLLYNMKELLPSAATAAVVGENADSEPVEITVDDTAPHLRLCVQDRCRPVCGQAELYQGPVRQAERNQQRHQCPHRPAGAPGQNIDRMRQKTDRHPRHCGR